MKKSKIFTVIAATMALIFALPSCDLILDILGEGNQTEDSNEKDKDKDKTEKISVTVVYKEISDLNEYDYISTEEVEAKFAEWETLSAEEKADYNNDREEYVEELRFSLILTKNRYHAGKTYELTPSEIFEKFPSNVYKYYTTYNKYPVWDWEQEKDLSGNIKWDRKSKVSSLTILCDPDFIYPNSITSEDDEARFYFWDETTKTYSYCLLLPKGGMLDDYYHGQYRHIDVFTDKARTKRAEYEDYENSVKFYCATRVYEKLQISVNNEPLYDEEKEEYVELSLDEIKKRYPESEGWTYWWFDLGAERGHFETWIGQSANIWIFDSEHNAYDYE